MCEKSDPCSKQDNLINTVPLVYQNRPRHPHGNPRSQIGRREPVGRQPGLLLRQPRGRSPRHAALPTLLLRLSGGRSRRRRSRATGRSVLELTLSFSHGHCHSHSHRHSDSSHTTCVHASRGRASAAFNAALLAASSGAGGGGDPGGMLQKSVSQLHSQQVAALLGNAAAAAAAQQADAEASSNA